MNNSNGTQLLRPAIIIRIIPLSIIQQYSLLLGPFQSILMGISHTSMDRLKACNEYRYTKQVGYKMFFWAKGKRGGNYFRYGLLNLNGISWHSPRMESSMIAVGAQFLFSCSPFVVCPVVCTDLPHRKR